MLLAVDFHVHVYPNFPRAALLASIASRAKSAGCNAAAIFLTERQDCNWYKQEARTAELKKIILDANGIPCVVFPGFQTVTSEGIEVHALATTKRPIDGRDLQDTVSEIRASGGIPMLGWGAGKWTGKRCKIIESFVNGATEQIYLGDSRHRPRGWPAPKVFDGRRILNGSDPLPLLGEETAALSYGHIFELNVSYPEQTTSEALLGSIPINQLGARLDPIRFGVLQTRLRL